MRWILCGLGPPSVCIVLGSNGIHDQKCQYLGNLPMYISSEKCDKQGPITRSLWPLWQSMPMLDWDRARYPAHANATTMLSNMMSEQARRSYGIHTSMLSKVMPGSA